MILRHASATPVHQRPSRFLVATAKAPVLGPLEVCFSQLAL